MKDRIKEISEATSTQRSSLENHRRRAARMEEAHQISKQALQERVKLFKEGKTTLSDADAKVVLDALAQGAKISQENTVPLVANPRWGGSGYGDGYQQYWSNKFQATGERDSDLYGAFVGPGQNPMDRYPAQQTGTDAGPSSQREVSNEEKREALNKLQINKVQNKVAAAKRRKFPGYDQNSHFITNYKKLAAYSQHKQLEKLDSAYEAYEEIREIYSANRYNSWEKRCCELMKI